jgi:hypothetical protein
MPLSTRTLAFSLALMGLACGYRQLAVPDDLGGDIEIRMLENRSNEPGLEKMLQDAVAEEFRRRGELEPRFGTTSSGLVFDGVVREVLVHTTAFSSVALALEDEVEVVLDVSIERSPSGAVVWQRNGWTESERFTASADAQTYDSNRSQALRRLASLFAGRIHDELLQSF